MGLLKQSPLLGLSVVIHLLIARIRLSLKSHRRFRLISNIQTHLHGLRQGD